MLNINELDEYNKEYNQTSIQFSDNFDSIFKDSCEIKLNDDKMSSTEEFIHNMGIKSEFVAFFDDIEEPEI
ncbi:8234_t:CDS:1, partial [Scutellospora calospora]